MACTCRPGKSLCRSCLNQTTTPYVGSAVNGNGQYTTHQINLFQKQFETTIAADLQLNPLSAAISKYGSESFYGAVTKINNDFLKREFIVKKLPEYEVLSARLERGDITALEFASFMKDSSYTPSTVLVSANAQGPRFLKELDDYYNGDFSTSVLGGFCSLFANIFGAINGFFDLIDSVQGLVNDVFELINKIKNIENLLLAAWEKLKVKALLEAIKKKITETIEGVINKVCMSIANFNVEAITGPITTPVQINVAAKVEEKKSALEEVCGPENAKRILDKIQSLIDYAVSLFENPSVEEIMFLISRICALATGIEGLFKGLKGPLDDFANRYDEVFNTISNASNRITGAAIAGGAIRLSEADRQEQINKAKEIWIKSGMIAPTTMEELNNLPKWAALKAGSDARLKIAGGWVTKMTPASEGWTMLDTDVKVLVMRLQKAAKEAGITNNHLTLYSGYRSPAYNKAVGGVKSSQHMSGFAADLTWSGFRGYSVETSRFINIARSIGFRGIGIYNGFVHVDIGPERQWDKRT